MGGGEWRNMALRKLVMDLSDAIGEGEVAATGALALVVAVARHEQRTPDAVAGELVDLSGDMLAGAVGDIASRTVAALNRGARLDGRDHRRCIVGGSGPCRAVHTARAAAAMMRQEVIGLAEAHEALRAIRDAMAAGARADRETRMLRLFEEE